MAGVQPGAKDVVFYGADEYESSVPFATAIKSDSMLAWQMNDEPLWPKHGAPLRVVLSGIYGYKQVKWLNRIEVVQRNHKGFWEQRGYSDDGTIKG
jgi:DMSO/TMAO reductase YedYZ molybdopterin-dependent catalytic subunit